MKKAEEIFNIKAEYNKWLKELTNDEKELVLEMINEALRLSAVSYQFPHYFNAPDEDKSSRFCRCGKYLTDDVHLRQLKH